MADIYLENVLKYVNHGNLKLVEQVVECIETLFEKLQKETQFALICHIKEAIESATVDFE